VVNKNEAFPFAHESVPGPDARRLHADQPLTWSGSWTLRFGYCNDIERSELRDSTVLDRSVVSPTLAFKLPLAVTASTSRAD
jgi:hypothetical protein